MTKRQGLIFKAVILFFGLLILSVAFSLMTAGRNVSGAEIFLWVTVGVDYLVFFVPLFFNDVTFNNFLRRTIPIVLLWNSAIIYCTITILIAIAVFYERVALGAGVTIDLAITFIALIVIFISAVASDHVGSVEKREANLFGNIITIRQEFALLNNKVATCKGVADSDKKRVATLTEDLRYMAPVNNKHGFEIENNILKNIARLNESLDNITNRAAGNDFSAILLETATFIEERKLLRSE